RGGRLCWIEPAAASIGGVRRSSDTHLQDWQRRSSRCTVHAGPIRHAVYSSHRRAGDSVEVPRPSQTQTNCRGCDAQAFGAVLRCAENRQTLRCRDRDGLLSHIKALIAWRRRQGSSPAVRRGAQRYAGLTHAFASNTLPCQHELLHSKQLRSIKNPIDSDHGIYCELLRPCAPHHYSCSHGGIPFKLLPWPRTV